MFKCFSDNSDIQLRLKTIMLISEADQGSVLLHTLLLAYEI